MKENAVEIGEVVAIVRTKEPGKTSVRIGRLLGQGLQGPNDTVVRQVEVAGEVEFYPGTEKVVVPAVRNLEIITPAHKSTPIGVDESVPLIPITGDRFTIPAGSAEGEPGSTTVILK